jgi:hypothetical protein
MGRSLGFYERWTRRAFDRSDDGGKFQQHAVAGRLDDAAAEVGHDRLCGFATFTYRARSIHLVLAMRRE